MAKQTRRLHKSPTGDGSSEIPATNHVNSARLAYLYLAGEGLSHWIARRGSAQPERDLISSTGTRLKSEQSRTA